LVIRESLNKKNELQARASRVDVDWRA